MKKLITGQLSDALYPIMDGVAVVAQNYTYWLNKKYGPSYSIGARVPGFQVRDENALRYLSLPIPKARPYRYGIPAFDRTFKRDLHAIPFDIVHTHSPFVCGNLGLEVARKRRIPLVTTFHSKYRDDFLRYVRSERIVDIAIRHVMKYYDKADSVWVPNESSGETLRSYGYKGKYEVVLNGTDFTLPSSEKTAEYRKKGLQRIGSSDDDIFTCLFVGQHTWKKNLKLIIEGLNKFRKEHADFRMIFVGTGPDEQAIKDMVKDHHLEDQSIFVGSIENREEIKEIFSISDLFIFPSIYDNAPIVVREAAAFKIPAILMKGSNSANGIIHGANGFLIDNDSTELADMIAELYHDRSKIITAGNGAYRTVFKHWEQIVDEAHERYLKIIHDFKN